jgi:hypothetical protein
MAREACVARKWEDCSDDKLMMYVFRFDEKNPMAFLNKVDKDYAQNSE